MGTWRSKKGHEREMWGDVGLEKTPGGEGSLGFPRAHHSAGVTQVLG